MSTIAETLLDRLAVPPQGGPAWVAELRARAADVLRQSGLPHKKLEAWRFTPVAPSGWPIWDPPP